MDATAREFVARFLEAKASWSAWNDSIMAGAPRLVVPTFASPEAAADHYFRQLGNPYTGDPLFGALDHYLNPQRLQAALAAGPDAVRRLWIDCDDVAGWYLHATAGIPGLTAKIITLVDPELSFANGSHVILAGAHNGQAFGLDTNGYMPLPDLSEATLCQTWGRLYADHGFAYIGAVETPYPFPPASAA